MMQVAINYSREAATLCKAGQVQVDVFKCPAWPEIVDEALAIAPVYIHFPLNVARDLDSAIDTETGAPIDWQRIELLLARTDTPYVNLHLAPETDAYPDIPVDSTTPAHIERITADAIRSVEAATRRFGAERVILENVPDAGNQVMRPALLPEVLSHVVKATGCGFLLDISHARIAADFLGIDAHDYINALPVEHLREIHVTGIHRLTTHMIDMLRAAGIKNSAYERLVGRLVDHLPFTDDDWYFLDSCLEQIRNGAWHAPWVVAFEYGGVGGLWELVGDQSVMASQLPRLYDAVHASAPLQTG